jgi:hypothetical protein
VCDLHQLTLLTGTTNFFLSLVANFSNYEKGPHLRDGMDALFGHGIFNTNGDEWKFQRKTASQIFNVKNFRDHFTEYDFSTKAHSAYTCRMNQKKCFSFI